jgi:hypothetical protein
LDYQKIYNQLIKRSILQDRIKSTDIYYEKHHIVPKCIGGLDTSENLVLLTAREHFIAHKLLCKIYPENLKIKYALWAMINLQNSAQKRLYKISSREFEYYRNEYVSLMKQPKTIDHRKKLSKSWTLQRKLNFTQQRTGKSIIYKNGINPNKGKKNPEHSEWLKQNHPMKNKKHSEQTIDKIRLANIGKKRSEETSIKHKNTLAIKPTITCTYCNLTAKQSPNMTRYHFNNCKYKGI